MTVPECHSLRLMRCSPTPLAAPPGNTRHRLHQHHQSHPGSCPRDDTHTRTRRDRIDKSGTVTLRVGGRLRHIGVG